MPEIKAEYPKIIKQFYRFMDRDCLTNEEFEQEKANGEIKSKEKQDCLDKQDVLNLALATAIKEKVKDPESAIYYVNTRRIQKGDEQKQYIKKDFLN